MHFVEALNGIMFGRAFSDGTIEEQTFKRWKRMNVSVQSTKIDKGTS
jgi:hypothetical protein